MQEITPIPDILPSVTPTKFDKIRAIPWSLSYDIANTFFVQLTFFGSAFVLFLNDLHFDNTQIGLLLGIFPFLSLLSLVISRQVAAYGVKRSFLLSFIARSLFTVGLLFVPLLVPRVSSNSVLLYVFIVTTGFAVCRAVAMTALLPWQQEYVPDEIRGKYAAYSGILVSVAGLMAVGIAGYLINLPLGLLQYSILFGVGVVFGFISVLLAARIPGGAPVTQKKSAQGDEISRSSTLRDVNFMRYLVSVGLITLATSALFAFIPLFMQESVGLPPTNVVLLQTGVLIGSLLSSFFWGWLADRYGSKPIALTGLFLTLALPVSWFLMPRESPLSFPVAMGIALLQGIAVSGWAIGSGRLLFVSMVPVEHKTAYLSQYNASMGLLGGVGSILAGRLLDRFSAYQGEFLGQPVDSFSILMGIGFMLIFISFFVFRSIIIEREMGLWEFAGLFLHGNPLVAVNSLIRYSFPHDEFTTVAITESLGQAHSPLTVDELLKTLEDPRFSVRYEALISISRHSSDDRLTDAVIVMLEDNDPALSVMAAWALGRIGNPKAVPALRRAFTSSHYRSVAAHAARALGNLHDRESIPLLIRRIETDEDMGIQVACASALGTLEVIEAAPIILDILKRDRFTSSRKGLGLALARLLQAEGSYINMFRKLDQDPGVTLAQHMDGLRRSLEKKRALSGDQNHHLARATEVFAHEDLDGGLQIFLELLHSLPFEQFDSPCREILQESIFRLEEDQLNRKEYLILAIIALEKGW